MKSLRKFAYTVVLTVSALDLMASSATAQSARGKFNLSHEVHWQNSVVPAGEYEFSVMPTGPSVLLTLRPRSGGHQGFLLLANDVAPSRPSDLDRLMLVSRTGKSFVRSLELSSFGTTLYFTVPPESTGKEMALAGDSTPTR